MRTWDIHPRCHRVQAKGKLQAAQCPQETYQAAIAALASVVLVALASSGLIAALKADRAKTVAVARPARVLNRRSPVEVLTALAVLSGGVTNASKTFAGLAVAVPNGHCVDVTVATAGFARAIHCQWVSEVSIGTAARAIMLLLSDAATYTSHLLPS